MAISECLIYLVIRKTVSEDTHPATTLAFLVEQMEEIYSPGE